MTQQPATPTIQLHLHGAAGWRHARQPLRLLERKHAALLAWLWLEGPTPRARMAGLLWPEASEERARGNLRQRLLKLRQDAGDLVLDQDGQLALAPGVAVAPADPATAQLLQTLAFDDCDDFARWLDSRREDERQQRKRAWLAKVRDAAQSGRLDDALYAADQLLQTDRESEEAYRVLMEVYYLRGDHAAALSAWDRCRDMLRQLYGVLPSAATQQLGQTLLEAAQQARQADLAQAAWAPTPPANRPLPASVLRPPRLVARAAALQALVDGWQAGQVLLVAGVAGLGKSRLLADWHAWLAGASTTTPAGGATSTPGTAGLMASQGTPGMPGKAGLPMAKALATAACRPGDAVMPYAALGRLVSTALERFVPPLDSAHARQAARLLPALARLAGLGADQVAPVQSEHERQQALLALARLLADCAERGCAGLVLDDLQFADPASLAALQTLIRPANDDGDDGQGNGPGNGHRTEDPSGYSAAPGRPRWALAIRSDEVGPEAEALLARLLATGRLTRVDLQALTVAEATELLASLGVADLDAAVWAPRLWQQVGGNPAFLLESAKLLLTSVASTSPSPGASSDTPTGPSTSPGTAPLPGTHRLPATPTARTAAPPSLPATIEAVIQRRLELLSPRARHLAQLAAIAAGGYSVPLAAAALACAPIELAEPLRELEQRQVFHGRQFVHDVIATVTARSVPGTVAEFMHRFVAEHLLAHGGEPAHLAAHWAACGEWRRAGDAWVQAAQAARRAALANETAALLDQAIAAYERSPAAHDALFDALDQRADTFESQGHEGLRPQMVQRLRSLARTESQHLSALNHHYGWLTNLGRAVDEAEALSAIQRAQAIDRPLLAWELARVLSWQWAMNNRADDGLALLAQHEGWVLAQPDLATRANHHQARASIFAYGDRLPEALAEGRLALAAASAANDWPQALPTMSNLGLMHYWRGEYRDAHDVLAHARTQRERLYGSAGSGIKIDIHLGAVLYELGQDDAAQAMLQGALAEIHRWPVNEYQRTDLLLAHNHLAQMHLARGHADAAAAVLAEDASGVADRFYGRRLALRLRWQRLFGQPDPALVAELQALAARVASPFNRSLMDLELARQLPPDQALAEFERLHDSPVAVQRPGLQLHAAALAADAAARAGLADAAQRHGQAARALQARCAPFDMAADEAQALLDGVAQRLG